MKICIYGAGAIGGYLGVQLARAGADVSRNNGAERQNYPISDIIFSAEALVFRIS